MLFRLPYFRLKSFGFFGVWLLVCFCVMPSQLLIKIFFRCFGMSCVVCIVSPFVDISLVSLLSPEPSGLFPQVLLAAQNRTNHIKARIDKTQQNSKCRLCGERDETINHIISECSKLAQKEYKVRHDWVGTVIHCARNLYLAIPTKGICTTQHLS